MNLAELAPLGTAAKSVYFWPAVLYLVFLGFFIIVAVYVEKRYVMKPKSARRNRRKRIVRSLY